MIIVYAFEFLVFVLLLSGIVTQVIIPLWRGTPVFPLFRKEQRKLESKLTEAKGATEEAHLEHKLQEERRRTRRVRRGEGTS